MRSYQEALSLVPVACALVACGRPAFPPVPDGEPTKPARSQVVAKWTDTHGGTLRLKSDGTFVADDLCRDFFDFDDDGLDYEPRSDSGTWHDSDRKGQTSVDMPFEADGVSFGYESLRDGRTLKPWSYVGDPGEGRPPCILTPRQG
ncbi:hypothetical protein [Streptomyces sp. NPDC002580]|uniref:hypothetical protein n=1 Tax=Streptomyces sp. NPDC002580 TaxID=3364653 RepID=UPI0036BA5F3A